MKRVLIILMVMLFGMSVFAMGQAEPRQSTAEEKQVEQTNQALSEMERQVGMPSIVNFQERRLAKMIFELRDQSDLATYAYIVSMSGQLIFLGECVGFGLPYSVQYTNPMKMGYVDGGQYGALNPYTTPMADPNGLYMPEGLSATWLMMLDKTTGEVKPVYVEPEIIVSPFPLH